MFVSRAKTGGVQPKFIKDSEMWEEMRVHWENPDVIEKSKKCSAARMSERGTLSPHKHSAGSISFEAHGEKIVRA